MNLNQEETPRLLLQPSLVNANGTLRANSQMLAKMGFSHCIVGGRPCRGATVIDPSAKKTTMVVCCSLRHEEVSVEGAARCTRQQ